MSLETKMLALEVPWGIFLRLLLLNIYTHIKDYFLISKILGLKDSQEMKWYSSGKYAGRFQGPGMNG